MDDVIVFVSTEPSPPTITPDPPPRASRRPSTRSATTTITVESNARPTGPGYLRWLIRLVCGTSGKPVCDWTRSDGPTTSSIRAKLAEGSEQGDDVRSDRDRPWRTRSRDRRAGRRPSRARGRSDTRCAASRDRRSRGPSCRRSCRASPQRVRRSSSSPVTMSDHAGFLVDEDFDLRLRIDRRGELDVIERVGLRGRRDGAGEIVDEARRRHRRRLKARATRSSARTSGRDRRETSASAA